MGEPSIAPRRVAVTGATGIVGQFVVQRLLREGVEVVAATRVVRADSSPTAKLLWREFALNDAGQSKSLLAGCDALVHCAFVHEAGRYRGGEGDDTAGFWQHNLGGTLQLLDTCVSSGVRRALLMSSRAVFGSGSSPSTVVDGSPTAPDTHYGALKCAEESLARVFAHEQSLATACVRPTGVFGVLANPADSKWWPDVKQVVAGQPITRCRFATEVHGSDVADAVWRLLCAPDEAMQGQAYNCSDLRLSTRTLASQLNRFTRQELALPEGSDALASGPEMLCPGLRELGWAPQGEEYLTATLQALVQFARSAASSGSE